MKPDIASRNPEEFLPEEPIHIDGPEDFRYDARRSHPLPRKALWELHQKPSGHTMYYQLWTGMKPTDFEPTGYYLPPGRVLLLKVDQLSGSYQPELLVGTYSRYTAKYNPTSYTLKIGINTISDELGGILYFRYHAEQPTSSVRVELQSGAVPIPYYQRGTTTHAEWLQMLTSAGDVPDVQLVSRKYALITASLENALKYKDENQDTLLDLFDTFIDAEHSIAGLDGETERDRRPPYRHLFTESDAPSVWMAATYYRSFYASSAMNHLLTVKGIKDGWGPWHEHGHMSQVSSWTWSEVIETTVNIYSLAAERIISGKKYPSRVSDLWPETQAFLKLPDNERIFNGSRSGIWLRLVLFYQLWMAFGDDFYHQLHKLSRKERAGSQSDRDKMIYLMISSCKVSGYNLSDFFYKWGFLPHVGQEVFEEIDKMELKHLAYDLSQVSSKDMYVTGLKPVITYEHHSDVPGHIGTHIIKGHYELTLYQEAARITPITLTYPIYVKIKSTVNDTGKITETTSWVKLEAGLATHKVASYENSRIVYQGSLDNYRKETAEILPHIGYVMV